MTKETAATVASALVNAGYNAQTLLRDDGTYIVQAQSTMGLVDASAISTFAAAQGVAAKIDTAQFV